MNDQARLVEGNIEAVVKKAEKVLGGILNESGTILYSSCATLARGRYYFLGLNPGGVADGTNTIRESLDNLMSLTRNAYLCEDWCGRQGCEEHIGKHPLQQNYRALFDALGPDLESICSTNLIFKRSRREKDAGGWNAAELCWPVHEEILKIIRPQAIIAFGKLPFDFIHDKMDGDKPQRNPSGWGNWEWRCSVLKDGEKLIGLPHLSIYDLRNRPTVIDGIKASLGLA